jgi:uncharacterized protein YyaL (SSP411 family)
VQEHGHANAAGAVCLDAGSLRSRWQVDAARAGDSARPVEGRRPRDRSARDAHHFGIIMSTMSRPKNRLASAASPYLRQHEHNPVDWWPWCDEALAKAEAGDRPILLSIGYSACHWCHVMAHECFEDGAIAAQMSRDFVCIKVDREERPDLDQIYQLAVQVMGRSGGWPLTVFLTPERKPFFAGTYFPPRDKFGLPGFSKVLEAVFDAYRNKRSEVDAQAGELADAILRVTRVAGEGKGASSAALEGDLLERATKAMSRRFDDAHGGFGHRPKFPNTMALDVMLRRSVESPRDAQSETRVKRALGAMRAGGIWDQLGGGFHRYSTDERWLVPHFEKMLYDNALLARLYADASRAYAEPRLADVARDVLRYVAREMTAADGAFYSTQDADSLPPGAAAAAHAEEGAFFVFTPKQLVDALPSDEEAARVASVAFGITEYGNFEESGATVLREAMTIDAVASQLDLPLDVAKAAFERASRGMFAAREQRPRPFRDEKVLASWNALMIGACAEVFMATGDTAARAMAELAFEAIEARLVRGERLMRVAPPPGHAGEPTIYGFLDDYAFVANAALDLYDATATPRYVDVARASGAGAPSSAKRRRSRSAIIDEPDGNA